MNLEEKKVGQSFEIDGVHYVVVDTGKRHPKSHQPMWPQPDAAGEEYIHSDGHIHICANTRCPKLVLRTRNPGKPRIYCDNTCNRAVQARKNDAKRTVLQYLRYDPLNRLFAVITGTVQRSTLGAKHALDKHLNDPLERCPEATEASNFVCPSVHNQSYYSEAKWAAWHQPGDWPGACLIAATLKDQFRRAYYEERGQKATSEYTQCRGPQWRWKDEDEMLPLPEGIVRA